MVVLVFLVMSLWGVLSDMLLQNVSAPPGGSVVFQVQRPTHGDVYSIFWASNRTGMKKMLAIAKPRSFLVIDTRFNKRAACQGPELSLNLSGLREDDSGVYEAEIYSSDNTKHLYFQLQVKDEGRHDGGSHPGRAQGTGSNICLTSGLGILLTNIIGET